MFTILHKRDESGFRVENLFKAVQLQYIPYSDEAGDVAGLHLLGDTEVDPSVRIGMLRDGVAYVMNEKGATVATYHLDAPKSPPPPPKPNNCQRRHKRR